MNTEQLKKIEGIIDILNANGLVAYPDTYKHLENNPKSLRSTAEDIVQLITPSHDAKKIEEIKKKFNEEFHPYSLYTTDFVDNENEDIEAHDLVWNFFLPHLTSPQQDEKKIEEIKKDVLDIVYTHLKVTGIKEVENKIYEEYVCKGDLVQDLCDYIVKTTPHLISSDEIKREEIKEFVEWVNDRVYKWQLGGDVVGLTGDRLRGWINEFILTQSKEGGE